MADPALSRLSDTLFWIAFAVYAGATIVSFAGLAYRARRVQLAGVVLLWIGAAANTGWAVARGAAVDRVPWGNMFEYSSMVALLIALSYLVLVDVRMKLRQIAGFASAGALLSLGTASLVYVPPLQLQPALNSQWLRVHVIAAIISSSLFGISFILTMLSLVQGRMERRAATAYAGSTVGAAYVGPTSETLAGMPADLDAREGEPERPDGGGWSRLPSASRLDQLAYRTVQFAFPLWTFAVIAGAMWAHRAWGRYWGWDPKETWAFVTWVLYAGYLHARATVGWKGTRAAVLNVVGFASVLFTYFAVNLWIAGLHSYKNG